MSKLLEDRINTWISLRGFKDGSPLQVRFEKELYPWVNPDIYVSDIPGLDFCTYQHGLTAKLFKESGKLPVPTEESRILMLGGKGDHERAGEALEIPSDVDFTREEIREAPRQALRRLLTSRKKAHTIEFPIASSFRGIHIRGRIDHIVFSRGAPKLVEEWKFTKNGQVKPSHILQAKIYSYLIYKWLDILGFKYVVKAWPWGSWSKDQQLDALEFDTSRVEPSDIITKEFTEATIREVEPSLNRARLFYTGESACQALPGLGCKWCPHKECKFYEEPTQMKGTLKSVRDSKGDDRGEAVISFRGV